MSTEAKAFNDASEYDGEIRRLVPGYDGLHAMLPAVLRAASPTEARLLIVGCGPAREVVAIADALPGSTIDALDPSPAMATAARETLRAAGLTERVQVFASTLADFNVQRRYDAVIAVLVGHLIADDGPRAGFLADLARALQPGGVAVLAELEDLEAARPFITEAHVRCSALAGVPQDRLELLRKRLTTGFHAITRARLVELSARGGLRVKAEFFRAFGFVGLVLERDA